MTTAAPTATEAIARELVELCKAGRNLEALDKLYTTNIESIEPMDFDGMPARLTGIDAIRKKNQWWFENFEMHDHTVEGPYVNGDQFAVKYMFDATNKKTGVRARNTEVAVYTVKDGKIVQERFFSEVNE